MGRVKAIGSRNFSKSFNARIFTVMEEKGMTMIGWWEGLAEAVTEICKAQTELGVDVINDGEFGKPSSGAID